MATQNQVPPKSGISAPSISAPTYSSIAGAITGIVLWSLSTYAFRGQAVPGPVEAGAWVIIPSAVSGIASLVTRRTTK